MSDMNYKARVNAFVDAVEGRPTEHIPVYLMMDGLYAVHATGGNIKKATYNPQIVIDSTRELVSQVYCDGLGNIFTKGAIFYKRMRSNNFIPSEVGFLQHPETYTLSNEELTELAEDPFKTIAEKVFLRSMGEIDKPFPQNMYSLMIANMGNTAYLNGLISKKFALSAELGVPMVYTNLTKAPLDYLGSSVRGLANIFTDIRRTPDRVIAACDALCPLLEAAGELNFRAPDRNFPFIFFPTLIPHFLNVKQFERVYYPTFKRMLDNLADKGFKFVIQFEGNWERFYDIIRSLPENKILGVFEMGSPALAKEKLGDMMCLSGLYPVSLLGCGEKGKCLDKAKEIVDVMAPGGRYVFATDKQLINARDARIENIQAVHAFVHDYQ